MGIPSEQIKIKTADKDELQGVDLMARDCPVRYIVTVNALKEGWDCPFAYILASLANRTSPIDVEQILGRVLRLPHTEKHSDELLNLSYVFTNSNDFQTTVTRIIESLMKCGFSKKDFREITPVEVPQVETPQASTPDLFSQQNSPIVPATASVQETVSQDEEQDFGEEDLLEMTEEEREQVRVSLASQGESVVDTDTERLQQEALRQEEHYSEQIKKSQETVTNDPLSAIAPHEL